MPGSTLWRAGVAALALIAAGAANAGPIEDAVALDRAYVPALVLTNQPQKPAAATTEALARLKSAWPKLRGAASNDAAAIAETDAKIREAEQLLGAGSRQGAHDALEGVRIALWKARAARGLDYYPDRLTAFHEEMETIVDLAAEPAFDAAKLKRQLAEASALWSRVEGARFDATLFGFDAERTARLNGLVKKEREILGQLDASLASANREAVAAGAKALRANFGQTYMLFGDFTGL
jgi:hypothetical protein